VGSKGNKKGLQRSVKNFISKLELEKGGNEDCMGEKTMIEDVEEKTTPSYSGVIVIAWRRGGDYENERNGDRPKAFRDGRRISALFRLEEGG